MKLSPTTLRGIRAAASRMREGTCKIYTRSQQSSQYGANRSKSLYAVPAEDGAELEFWTNLGIAAGTSTWEVRLQPVRDEERKSLSISEDRLLYWVFLPWYMEEVDQHRSSPLIQQGGVIEIVTPADYGEFEIEQAMSRTTGNRGYCRIMCSQRQTS